jgi:hypothetical protein
MQVPRSLLALGFMVHAAAAQVISPDGIGIGAFPAAGADGFMPLFNGHNLAGWTGLPGYWSVIDGSISGHENMENSKQTFLVFAGLQIKDFDLRLRYPFASFAGNSGIQFRSTLLDAEAFRVGGYQADFDADRAFDGSIYDEAGVAGGRSTMSNRGERTVWDTENKRQSEPLKQQVSDLKQIIRAGDWNDVAIVARGPHIVYSINGYVMTDLIDNSPWALRKGLLGLQLHQGFTMDVRFTDVRLKILNQ